MVSLIFMWTGFVRSGLGFGGAALGLPLFFFIIPDALIWLPIIGLHLLVAAALTLYGETSKIDYAFLKKNFGWTIIPNLIGILGLITLPAQWLVLFIYSISIIYALQWLFNWGYRSQMRWQDYGLLMLAGYVMGTSLSGAPILLQVVVRQVSRHRLKSTLFVMWVIFTSIKLSSFVIVGISVQWVMALLMLPFAGIGHYFGVMVHQKMIENERSTKNVMGVVLILISVLGMYRALE